MPLVHGPSATLPYEDPKMTPEDAADAGIAALDAAKEVPGDWRELVDWTKIDQNSPDRCVLAQIFGDGTPVSWIAVFDNFLMHHPEITENIAAYGFAWGIDVETLNDAWRDRAMGLIP